MCFRSRKTSPVSRCYSSSTPKTFFFLDKNIFKPLFLPTINYWQVINIMHSTITYNFTVFLTCPNLSKQFLLFQAITIIMIHFLTHTLLPPFLTDAFITIVLYLLTFSAIQTEKKVYCSIFNLLTLLNLNCFYVQQTVVAYSK